MGLGAHEQAEQSEREALKIAEKTWGTTNEFTAEVMTGLAEILFERASADRHGARVLEIRARTAECRKLYTAALESRRAIFGDHHIAYAESLANMAKTSFISSRFDEAEKMLLQALSIQTNVLGANCLESLATLISLASVLMNMNNGRTEEALGIVDRILAGKIRVLGENHPEIVGCLHSCAIVRERVGDSKGAEPYFERGVALAEKILGIGHPETQEIRMNAAHSLLGQGRREEALALINRPLTPEFLSSPKAEPMLEHRADLLGRAGMWKEAALDFERLIQISPSNNVYYLKLLPLLFRDGERHRYQTLCRQALKDCSLNDEIAAGRIAMVCLLEPPAECLDEIGRLAEFALEQASKRTNSHFVPGRQFILGMVRFRQNRLDEAVELGAKAAGTKVEHAISDFSRAEGNLLLSMAYWRQGRAESAAESLNTARAIIAKLPSPKDADMGSLWNNVALVEVWLREAEQTLKPSVHTQR